MERLTYDFCIGGNHCWQVKGADNNLCKDVCKQQGDNGCERCPIRNAFDRLAAYEDSMPLERAQELAQAEKDGRLMVLPCSLKQPLYILKNGEVHRNYGCQWHFTDKECQAFGTLSMYGEFVRLDDFGKTIFLTREEAETALKKREAENETD